MLARSCTAATSSTLRSPQSTLRIMIMRVVEGKRIGQPAGRVVFLPQEAVAAEDSALWGRWPCAMLNGATPPFERILYSTVYFVQYSTVSILSWQNLVFPPCKCSVTAPEPNATSGYAYIYPSPSPLRTHHPKHTQVGTLPASHLHYFAIISTHTRFSSLVCFFAAKMKFTVPCAVLALAGYVSAEAAPFPITLAARQAGCSSGSPCAASVAAIPSCAVGFPSCSHETLIN